MKNILLPLITAFLFVSTASFAGDDEVMLDRPSFSASQTITTAAVVTAINKETRVVTLQQDDGEEITFTASDEVRNLDQVSVGDILVAEYVETISIEVMANDGMEAAAAGAAAMARTEKARCLDLQRWMQPWLLRPSKKSILKKIPSSSKKRTAR